MLPKALTIGYCGPIAQRGEPARGGFEAANRRLIDDLERAGLDVIELAYAPERKPLWRKALAYATGFAGLVLRIAFGAQRLDVFHITPLRRHFILLEFTALPAGHLAWGQARSGFSGPVPLPRIRRAGAGRGGLRSKACSVCRI